MFDERTIRNFAFEGVNMDILKVYAKNVVDILLNSLRGKRDLIVSLLDLEHMYDDNGNSINKLYAMYGMNSFTRDAELCASDVKNINSLPLYWSVYGKLQSLCMCYSEDEEGILNTCFCIGNLTLFKIMLFNRFFDDIDVVKDKRVTTAIKRLTVRSQKQFNDTKARNYHTDLLLGNDKGEHTFCGPRMEYDAYISNTNNNTKMTFSNSAGMSVKETLFVPLALLYIISDVFEVIMLHSKDARFATIEGKLCDNEVEVVNYIKGYAYPILAESNNIRFRAFKIYTLKNKKGLIKELANGASSLKNWSKRGVNANQRGVTLSTDIIHRIYGTTIKSKKEVKYIETQCSKNKVEAGANKLGFRLPMANIFFYNTRSESSSTELVAFAPYNFAYITSYKMEDIVSAVKSRQNSSQYPHVIMLSVYLDYIDYIFEKKLNNLDRLWYLTSVPDNIIEKELYSDNHYNFMVNSAKYYSATDIYDIISDPELSSIFFDFNSRCEQRKVQFGIKGERVAVNLKEVDSNMSDETKMNLRNTRKEIIENALKTGICMVEYKRKTVAKRGRNQRTQRYYVTCNRDLVKKIYGDNYIGVYGSLTYRLKELDYRNKKARNVDDLNKAIRELAIMEIAGKDIEISAGKTITCDNITPTADFSLYKQIIDTFVQNMVIKLGIKSFENDTLNNKEEADKQICAINVVAPKKDSMLNKNGSSTFNIWLLESGVVSLYMIK